MPWPVPCVVAVAGVAATAVLRVRARAQHRVEAREVARNWATLEPTLPRHGRNQGRTEHTFAALVVSGVVVALTAEALLVVAGPDQGWGRWAVTTAPAAVLCVFLVLAATYARMARHRAMADRTRSPR
ncbi:hypothetical protein [Streptomyces canus]|uniref:hypothetical protein n=1 Tax=Streptomyces canus TaxID=58343 RepID=UPI0036EE0262